MVTCYINFVLLIKYLNLIVTNHTVSRIKLLDEETIKQIAAGEVVERPASVVKEIVENSIDAGSTKIVVKVDTKEYFSISIEDNGHGIQKDDIDKVFINHATSKISKFKDLEALNTMGFRGEALSSISAVSESIELMSLNAGETIGSRAIYTDGRIETSDFKKPTSGTIISINSLFKNVPARQKFLKSKNTEVRNIIETFINTSLLFTDIHFELIIDNKTSTLLPKTKLFKDRLYDAFGGNISKNLIQVDYESEHLNISGFLGVPEIFSQNKKTQYIYINRRYVKNQTIISAIKKASTGLAHRDLNPVFFLNLSLHPSKFDINVHPRKTEVKFENEQEIFLNIYKLTKQLLISNLNQITSNGDIKSEDNAGIFTNRQNSENHGYSQRFNELSLNYKDTFSQTTAKDTLNGKHIRQGLEVNRSLFESLDYRNNDVDNVNFVSETHENYSSSHKVITKAFQIMKTYIVFEFNSEMYIVDQHAAAEKINFDLLVKKTGIIEKKNLLIPHIHEFKSKFEMDTFLSQLDEFSELGFEISEAGNNTIKIDSIPLIGDVQDISSLIDSSISQTDNDFDLNYIELNNLKITKSIYLKMATIACHSSLRAGQSLKEIEAIDLAKKVMKLEGPLTCPHGRPILIKYNNYELEKLFRRNL